MIVTRTFLAQGLLALLLAGALGEGTSAEQQSPAGQNETKDQQSVRIKTNEVMLDIIARDKKGRPVLDLQPDEVEIFENGIKQPITKFTAIRSGGAAQSSPSANPAGSNSTTKPLQLITIIFDHLTAQRVQPVRDAAYNFIDNAVTDQMLVRVMVIGRKLYVIEHFTSDRGKMKKAIEKATGAMEKSFVETSGRIAQELKTLVGDVAPTSSDKLTVLSSTDQTLLLAQMTLDALSGAEKMAQEIKSPLRIFTLLPLARAHNMIPGRKMALYFSDGLNIPSGVSDVLQTAVSEANRANLSFYTINIRTLLAGAGNQASRLESSTVVNQTRRPETAAYNSDNANSFSVSERSAGRTQTTTNFNTFESLDRNRELNKSGPLSKLTEGTGGVQITNLNDLNGALKRSAAELGQYYAVSYSPINQEYDGKFRAITVTIKRSGVKPQTRNGYFALSLNRVGRPSISYETPLLTALNGSVVPHDFNYSTGMLHFETEGNETRQALIVDLPLANFVHEEDREKKIYNLKFAVLGMVKDSKDQIVQQFSEPHEFEVPAAAIEGVRKSGLTLTRNFRLAPGKYRFETAVHDQSSGKISAQRQILNVRSYEGGAGETRDALQASSLFLVKQVEQLSAENSDQENPLIVENQKITPDLENRFSNREREELSFHLAIFSNPQMTEKPTLRLELLAGGKIVATTSPQLSRPDPQGRISFTAGLPAASFAPGDYVFRASIAQGSQGVEETASFTITGDARPEKTPIEEKTIGSSLNASDKIAELKLQAFKTLKAIELSPNDLIDLVRKNGAQMFDKLGDYTYSLRKVRRTLTPNGKIKGEQYQDYEAYPIKGKHALIQLTENGSQLAVGRLDLSRRSATDALVKNEADRDQGMQNSGYWGATIEGAAQRRGQPKRYIFVTLDPELLFNACTFSSPRSLLLEGRETVVLDFRPRPDFKFELEQQWLQKIAGTLWIDLAEKSLVRIEGYRLDGMAAQSLTSENGPLLFVYQQQRLAPNIWAPSLIRINTGGDENLLDGLNWDAWFEFSNYKRFDSQTTDPKIIGHEEKKEK